MKKTLLVTLFTTILFATSVFIIIQQLSETAKGPSEKYIEDQSVESFIGSIAENARDIASKHDLYASVMIAQAVLESNGGTSDLGSPPNNNLFGIKGSYKNQSVTFQTSEDNGTGKMHQIYAKFRKYPNYRASLEDYAELLQKGVSWNTKYYQKTFKSKTKSYKEATKYLTGTYATDTNYHQKLNTIIKQYHLTEYDHPAKAKKQVVVKSGETLHSLSNKYGVSVTSIKQWNRLNKNAVENGQRLLIYQ
ncbi:glucosaminidase domain-containing protein [Rummeliibacillus pycnus]|uniref:glucosaminidase domain-containing protein n=1 Tax=Rummeliibacillus pycnus TaxID=101070 RepID=UPI000C9C17FA|nr:glucosaminidase domain-containing protein [Rummeliibacillus pycnus]